MFVLSRGVFVRPMHAKEKGVTLIELLIGLGVISVLSLITFTFLGGVLSKSTTKETADLLSGTVSEVRVAYKNDTLTTANFTAPILINNKLVPPSMVNGNALKSPYGLVTPAVATGTPVATPGDTMQFTITNVPKEDCSNLVRAIDPFSNVILVGTTIVKPYQGVIDKAALGTSCNAAPTVSVILRSRIR